MRAEFKRGRSSILGTEQRFARPLQVGLRSADILHFLHIPKTGGTSLYEILASQFPEPQVFPRAARETLIDGLRSSATRQPFRYRLTRMHHDYSVYRYFPRKPIFVTMLRNPAERVVSLYGHIQRVVGHPLHTYLLERQLDLEGFCLDPIFQEGIHNAQVQYLVGKREEGVLTRAATLEIAKIRLDEFAFFGMVERFAESIHLLFHTFGWSEVEYAALNVRPEGASPTIDPRTLEIVRSLTELDHELYEYACGLFDKRIAQMIEEKWEEQKKGRLLLRSLRLMVIRGKDLKRLTDPSRIQLSRLRRVLVPEGSALEPIYVGLRKRLLGW